MLPPLGCRRQPWRPLRALSTMTLAYHGSGTRPAPGPSTNSGRLGRLELALGGGAVALGHFREALPLAGVQALAGMVAALASALALAGVRADAVAFARGVGRRRYGRTGQEQGCSGRCERSTRFGIQLHDDLLDDSSMTVIRREHAVIVRSRNDTT